MPMFDFKSPCGATFEKLVRSGELPQCTCGFAGCSPVRQLSAPGVIVFKGDGFYKPGASIK